MDGLRGPHLRKGEEGNRSGQRKEMSWDPDSHPQPTHRGLWSGPHVIPLQPSLPGCRLPWESAVLTRGLSAAGVDPKRGPEWYVTAPTVGYNDAITLSLCVLGK